MRLPIWRGWCLLVELRPRCRHGVLGICPRCWPAEVRTRRNHKLSLALAWLERLAVTDPAIRTTPQVQRIASDALKSVSEI